MRSGTHEIVEAQNPSYFFRFFMFFVETSRLEHPIAPEVTQGLLTISVI